MFINKKLAKLGITTSLAVIVSASSVMAEPTTIKVVTASDNQDDSNAANTDEVDLDIDTPMDTTTGPMITNNQSRCMGPQYEEIDLGGHIEVSGNLALGERVTIELVDANVEGPYYYHWFRGDARVPINGGESYTFLPADVGEDIWIRVHIGANYNCVQWYKLGDISGESGGNEESDKEELKDQKAPTVTGSYEVSSTDSSKFVYIVDQIEGAEYSKDGENYQDSNIFDGIEPGSEVTFYARLKAKDGFKTGEAGNTGAVDFEKLENHNKPSLEYTESGDFGDKTVVIAPVDGAEYKFGDDDWSDENEKSGITEKDICIQIRYKETDTQEDSDPASKHITFKETEIKPEIKTLEGKVVVTGNFICGETVKAELVDANVDGPFDCKWQRKGESSVLAEGNEYTLVEGDKGKKMKVVFTSPNAEGSVEYVCEVLVVAKPEEEPKEQEAPVVTGSYEVSKSDSSKFVYTVDAIEGAEYSKDGINYSDSNIFDGIDQNSEVTFYARLKAKDGFKTGEAGSTGIVQFGTIEISQEENDKDIELGYTVEGTFGNKTVTITPVEGAEYKFGKGDWSDDNTKTGLNQKSICIQIRYKETETTKASKAVKKTVSLCDTFAGQVSIEGNLVYGETLTANCQGVDEEVDVNYEWFRRGSNEVIATGKSYTLSKEDINKKMSVKASVNGAIGESKFTTDKAVAKAEQEAPVVTGSYEVSSIDSSKFVYTVELVEGAEYSNDGENYGDSNIFDMIDLGAEETFYVRLKETETHYMSDESTINVKFEKIENTNMPTLDYTESGDLGDKTVVITPVDGAEYKFGDDDWSDENEKSGITEKDICIQIRYKETDTEKESEAASKNITFKETEIEPEIKTLEGTVVLEGKLVCGETVKATLVDANVDGPFDCKWQRKGESGVLAESNEYTLAKEDVGKKMKIVFTSPNATGSIRYVCEVLVKDKPEEELKEQEAPVVTGSYEVSKSDSSKFVYTVDAIEGAEYSSDGINYTDSNIFDEIDQNSEVTFYARLKAKDGFKTGEAGSTGVVKFGTIETEKEENNKDIELSYTVSGDLGDKTVVIAPVDGAEYKFGDDVWSDENEKSGITSSEIELQIRYKETETTKPSKAVKKTATLCETFAGKPSIDGDFVYGKTLTASCQGVDEEVDVNYEWFREGSDEVIATGKTYTLQKEDIYKKMSVEASVNGAMGKEKFTSDIVVVKADQNAPTLSGSYKVSTNDSSKFVYTVDLVEGAEYSNDGENYGDSNIFDMIDPGSEDTFYVRLKETETHNMSDESTINVRFKKLKNTNVPTLEVTVTGEEDDKTITVKPVDGAEYKFGDDDWSDDNEKTGIKDDNVEVKVRFKETKTHEESDEVSTTVKTAEDAKGEAIIKGNAVYGETLSISLKDVDETKSLSYKWYRGESDEVISTAKTYTLVKEDVGKAIRAEVKPEGFKTLKVKSAVVAKAEQEAPVVSGRYKVSTKDSSKFVYTVDLVEGAEYSNDGQKYQDSNVFDLILPGSEDTFYVRLKETETHSVSDEATLNVRFKKLKNTNVPTLDYTVSGPDGDRTVIIKPVDGAEYKFGDDDWSDKNEKTGIKDDNVDVEIRFKETETNTASESVKSEDINLSKKVQKVTFKATQVNKTYGDLEFTNIASTTGDGTITYKSYDESVATVDSKTGKVKILKAGKVAIIATASETETYSSATTVYLLNVEKCTITIDVHDRETYEGYGMPTFRYTVTGLVRGEKLSKEPTINTSDVNLNRDGRYKITAKGAVAPNGDNYNAIVYKDGILTVKDRHNTSGGNGYAVPGHYDVISGANQEITEKNQDASFEFSIPHYRVLEVLVNDKVISENNYTIEGYRAEVILKSEYLDTLADGTYTLTVRGTDRSKTVTRFIIDRIHVSKKEFRFLDVYTTDWFHDSVYDTVEKGLLAGTSEYYFSPRNCTTRAMVWTVIARMNNAKLEGGYLWYEKAQIWAMNEGVSDGTKPNTDITREQFVTMLYRNEEKPRVSGVLTFADSNKVSPFAKGAMIWATQNDIIKGKDKNMLDPKGKLTRGEMAAILSRYSDRYLGKYLGRY